MGLTAAVLAGTTGLGVTVWALSRSSEVARPVALAARPSQTAPAPASALDLARMRPVRIVIDRIGVNAPVGPVGLRRDGTVQVPSLARVHEVGWYRYGPAPGERGPAVLLGHVDSGRGGPGVFHDLGTLRRGDAVRVVRADGGERRFTVTRLEKVAKDRFPTRRVYGDLAYPGLRLITCGGPFDRTRRGYTHNVIAWARAAGG